MDNKIQNQYMKKYIFWAVILLLVIVSFFIIKAFIVALISAFILAYLIKPLHSKMSNKMDKRLSAIICISIILLLIIVPLALLTGSVISQMNVFLSSDEGMFVKISSLPILENINLEEFKDKILGLFLSLLGPIFSYIPSLAISILITILGVYYILIDWEYLSKNLEGFLPYSDKKRIRNEISEITNSIVRGYILIALTEFIIASLGFYLSGVSAFLILAFLIALFAFIPGLGPGLIWIPTFLYYIIDKNYPTAIGVLITGLIISVIIDTLLLGKIVGGKSKIHPLVFLIGVFGGVPIFGIFGFIIGPLILVYSIKLLEESIKHD